MMTNEWIVNVIATQESCNVDQIRAIIEEHYLDDKITDSPIDRMVKTIEAEIETPLRFWNTCDHLMLINAVCKLYKFGKIQIEPFLLTPNEITQLIDEIDPSVKS